MTPKSPNQANYLEPKARYSHQSRTQTRFQTDPDYKKTPEVKKFCKNCRKKGHSISRCFKRKSNKSRQVNFESIQQYDAHSISATQKMLEDFFRNIQDLQTNVPLILMLLHINHKIVLPHNHIFGMKSLPQDKDSLHMILEIDIIILLTIVLDLSPQTTVTLFFAIHIIQNITRAILRVRNKTQSKSFATPDDHLLHFPPQLFKL